MAKKSPPIANPPWQRCTTYEVKHIGAIQALMRGVASEHQQKMILDFILNEVCALKYLEYDATNSNNTNFAAGKHAVGHQLVTLMEMKIDKLTEGNTSD